MSILLQREPSSASRRSTSTLIRRSSTMDRRSSLFGSLKQKFNKNSNSSSQPPENQQSSKMGFDSSRRINTQSLGAGAATPFGSGSSPTRRPNRAGMNAFSTPSNEPPPAYSPAAPGAVIGGATSPVTSPISIGGPASPSTPISPQRNTPLIRAPLPKDDRYAFLSSFDTVFLIDDSGSMAGRSWRETRQALETITPICTRHDADGIDIYFLNAVDNPAYQNVTSATEVVEIFRSVRPMGGTPTGQRLNKILKKYMAQFVEDQEHTKPLNIIVITDGEPSDDVESPIISTAKKLDKLDAPAWQIGIQFFQVGNEPGAKEHLKQLDDGLAELSGEDDLRDMVDTVPFSGAEGTELTGEGILKVVLGAVNRRLDRKKSKDLHRPILPELDGTP